MKLIYRAIFKKQFQTWSHNTFGAGVAINPGFEWSPDKSYGKSRLRMCFGNPSHEEIRDGVAVLADVCRRTFGVPNRIANVETFAENL